MRLYSLTGFSLSNDELSALSRLHFSGHSEIIEKGVIPDFHPAGVQLFLYYWTGIFGFSEFAVRFPFAIMGVVSVLLLFRIGKSWFGESTGLLAASALAVLEFPLLYSQIARPYSPGLMCGLAAVFFWTRFLGVGRQGDTDSNRRGYWWDGVGFALSISCCMYTHYFAFIFAGLVCFAGLFFVKRDTIWKYLVCGVLILVLYIPGWEVFTHQLAKGGIGGPDGWLSPPGSDAFGNYIDYCFNDSFLLKLIFFITFTGTVIIYRGKVPFTSRHYLSVFLFLTPFLIAYFYSILVNPVFQFSILLFSFPFLLLLLFSFLPIDRISFTSKFLLFVITIAGCHSTVNEKKYYETSHFTEFRAVSKGIQIAKQEYGSESVTVIANVHSPYYLNYYLEDTFKLRDTGVTRITSEQERDAFYAALATAKTPYLAYAYSNIYTPVEFDVAIRQYFPIVMQLDTFLNSGFRLYTRNIAERPIHDVADLVRSADMSAANFSSRVDTSNKINFAINFSPSDEFGPSVEGDASGFGLRKGCVIQGEATILDHDSLSGIMLVFSIEQGSNKVFYKANDGTLFRHGLKVPVKMSLVAELATEIPEDAVVKLYVWNKDKRSFKLQDLKLSVYRERPNTFFPPM